MAMLQPDDRVPPPLTARRTAPAAVAERLPLVLDLDGTLIASDLLLECALAFLKANPLNIVQLVLWALQGRALLKARLAERTEIAVELLPEHTAIVAYARAEHAGGRGVYMATASDRKLAEAVSRRYPFIREVMASGGRVNLKGKHKAAALKARFPDGFVYAGDSRADAPVWRQSAGAVYAGPKNGLHRVSEFADIEAAAPRNAPSARLWARALRLHQWSKNLLVFVPMMLAGKAAVPGLWGACALGFLGMSLIASGTYLINDLSDLEDDRRHPTKRARPLASGALPLKDAIVVAPLAVAAGLAACFTAGGPFAAAFAGLYCVGTLAYSLRLKRVPVLDVGVIAGLFTVRLVLGGAIAGAAASAWLLVFSMFLFVSLALAKRAVEIGRLSGQAGAAGRGYLVADAPLVAALGAATAVAAVLVLVLYLIEDAMPRAVYATPDLLWGAPLILSLWLGRVWLLCGRGALHEDPVVFAVRDRVSLILGGALAASFAAALVPHPWN